PTSTHNLRKRGEACSLVSTAPRLQLSAFFAKSQAPQDEPHREAVFASQASVQTQSASLKKPKTKKPHAKPSTVLSDLNRPIPPQANPVSNFHPQVCGAKYAVITNVLRRTVAPLGGE